MRNIKSLLLAAALILLSVALIYINWRQLWNEGTYSMKMAAFAPLVGVGGVYLLLFPGRAGKPSTTAEKISALMVFVIGLVAGLVNWYLMDPGFFGNGRGRATVNTRSKVIQAKTNDRILFMEPPLVGEVT